MPSATPADWLPAEVPPAAEVLSAAGVEPELAAILARRGVETPEQAKAFLSPSLDQLHDPFLLDGMEEAVEILLRARSGATPVAIVGDYDVDGVSATALLAAVLGASGLPVETILPRRLEEGYGFQPLHVEQARSAGAGVVITADCGSTAKDAVASALEAGLEVIVTDHHLGGGDLPAGAVEINPKKPGCAYPFAELSGVGLAFKLAMAYARRAELPLQPEALLRVACLGTIADLVPLVGENRAIAALGLAAFRHLRSPGLRALIQRAGVKPPVDAADVGFRLGPRINAAGRLGSAEAALELLLTRDTRRAASLAEELDRWNRDRQGEEARVVEQARERFAARDDLPNLLVAWDPGWHRGVVGIAAGRLAKEFYRPVVLLGADGDVVVGSGRSIARVSLHAFLEPWADRLERFGGHAMAVGLSAPRETMEELAREWEEAAAAWPEEDLQRTYRFEAELSAEQTDRRKLEELRRLEPHGEGNRQPLLKVGPVELTASPRSFGKGHLSGLLRGEAGGAVGMVAWRWQERAEELRGRIEVLAHLEHDDYRNQPRLRLVDCRPAAE